MDSKQSPIEDNIQALATFLGGRTSGGLPEQVRWSEVTSSSKEAKPGAIFVAYPGVEVDGHSFLDDAFQAGIEFAIVSNPEALGDRPGIVVDDARRALGLLCSRQYGDPAARLRKIGITGTNGKTTTHWLTFHALRLLEQSPVRVGSLGYYITDENQSIDSMTTPPAQKLHRLFYESVENDAKSLVMEVTSHALLQQRVAGLTFDVGVFTNLTPDHLDYHPDMESYFDAKKNLFTQSKSGVVNVDCEYGARLPQELGDYPLITFGKAADADVRIVSFEQDAAGSTLSLEYKGNSYQITTGLIGEFNGYNLTCAFTSLLAMGLEPKEVADALSQSPQPPGRLERFSHAGAQVIIDYAYAPDALENVLTTLRPITKGDLCVLFGCGGDRDPGRRTGMGNVAKQLADRVMLTSDNPRTEDPQKIVDDILATGITPEFIELDRKAAIKTAMNTIKQDDVLIIAGKGHEDYQIIGTEKVHLSDREEVLASIQGVT